MQIDVIPTNQSSSSTPHTCAQVPFLDSSFNKDSSRTRGIFGTLTVFQDSNPTTHSYSSHPEAGWLDELGTKAITVPNCLFFTCPCNSCDDIPL